MHEGVAGPVGAESASSTATANGAKRVKAISLTVGVLAQVDAESLKFWLGVLAEGGPAERRRDRGRPRCRPRPRARKCGDDYPVEPPRWSLTARPAARLAS